MEASGLDFGWILRGSGGFWAQFSVDFRRILKGFWYIRSTKNVENEKNKNTNRKQTTLKETLKKVKYGVTLGAILEWTFAYAQ